jgi:hypothetical protein
MKISPEAKRIAEGAKRSRGGEQPTPRPTPASSPAPPKKKDGPPVAYFDSSRGGFWSKNSRGEWIQYTEGALRRVLKYQHYDDVTDKDLQYSMIDRHLIDVQQTHDVAYAGALAGYKTGLHDVCGQRVLVTSGPRLITPKDGSWALLKDFLGVMLGDQCRVLYAWLKSALRSLYAGPPFRPGVMLAMAGPAGCGKSLLQNLITEIFGGRVAKPYRYMIGDTTFNSDLFTAEHLMIEDEAASTQLSVRRQFGSMLKNMIANEHQSLHRKGRDALMVSPFWRVTITVNDEPENLMVLPPIDESLRDKITLLKAFVPEFPYATDDMNARRQFRTQLSAELPMFLRFLQQWKIPANCTNQRYGTAAFQDEELLQELEELSPEYKLLAIIDRLQIWGVDREPWKGSATELEDLLLEKDKLRSVEKLLSFNTACGTYLTRLSRRFPERFKKHRTGKHGREWEIKPPAK